MNSKIQGNISRYLFFRFFSRFYFYFPTLIIFFKMQNLDLVEIAALVSIYSITVVMFTTISSILSDLYGRKIFLVLGEISKTLGVALLAIGNDVTMLSLGQFFSGLGFACVAGTDSAFLYENYVALNQESAYKEAEAKSQRILFFAVLIAGIIGAYFSNYNMRYPFMLTVPFNLIAAMIACTFVEVSKTKKGKEDGTIASVFKYILSDKLLSFYLLFYALLRGVIMTVFIGLIPFYLFESLNIHIVMFGILFAAYMLVGYFAGKYVNKLEKTFGSDRFAAFLGNALSLVLLLIAITKTKIGVILPGLMYYVAGSIRPFAFGNINELIRENKMRSTVLSIAELLYGVFNVIFIFIAFMMYKSYTLAHAFMGVFVIYSMLLVALLLLKKSTSMAGGYHEKL